jgi:hypothetical protein
MLFLNVPQDQGIPSDLVTPEDLERLEVLRALVILEVLVVLYPPSLQECQYSLAFLLGPQIPATHNPFIT